MAIKKINDLVSFLIKRQIQIGSCNSLLLQNKFFQFSKELQNDNNYKSEFIYNLYSNNQNFKILDINPQQIKSIFLRFLKTENTLDEKFKVFNIFFNINTPSSCLSILSSIFKLNDENEKIKILEFYFKNYPLSSRTYDFENVVKKFLELIATSNYKDKYINCFKLFLEKNENIMLLEDLSLMKDSIRNNFNLKYWGDFFHIDKSTVDETLISEENLNIIAININSLAFLAKNPFLIELQDANRFISNSIEILKNFSSQLNIKELYLNGDNLNNNRILYFSSYQDINKTKTIQFINSFLEFVVEQSIKNNTIKSQINNSDFNIFFNNFDLSFSLKNNNNNYTKFKI